MKKIIALAAAFMLVFTAVCNAAMFSDTSGHWAEEQINALTMEGVINGLSDGSFAPNSTVTREQFLKMLLIATARSTNERALYENPPKTVDLSEQSPFSDVAADRWSYYYIKNAYGTLIFTEEYGDRFEPVRDITREEAAVWMSRALQLTEAEPGFTDSELIGNKAMVGAAASAGLITGFEDGSFGPGQTLTRAQAAVMLLRAGRLNAKLLLPYYPDTVKAFERDLNGDGTNESVQINANGGAYTVTVNGLTVLGGECETADNRYFIIDIDKSDPYNELAVAETDYNNMELAVYRYTGSELYLMGRIKTAGEIAVRTDSTPIGDDWGAISVNRDGTITANIGVQFVHTMLVRKQYKINDKMRLECAENEFYTIGSYSDFTVLNYLESEKSDPQHPGIKLTPGYTGKIVKTDLKNWIYIETGSGDSGWIYVNDDGGVNGQHLSYYLDGLNYAG